MKKVFLSITLTIMTILLFSTVVFAAESYQAAVTPSKTTAGAGETITVEVNLKNIAIDPGIGAITGKIEYDQNVFEKITGTNIKNASGWGTVVYNDKAETGKEGSFAVERSAGDTIKTDNAIFEVSFVVKSGAKVGATEIKVSELSASNGEEDFESATATTSVTVSAAATVTPTPTPVTTTPTPTPATTTPTPTPATTTPTPTATPKNNNTTNNNTTNNTTNNNTTNNTITILPYAGGSNFIIPVMLVIVVIAIVSYIKFRKQ